MSRVWFDQLYFDISEANTQCLLSLPCYRTGNDHVSLLWSCVIRSIGLWVSTRARLHIQTLVTTPLFYKYSLLAITDLNSKNNYDTFIVTNIKPTTMKWLANNEEKFERHWKIEDTIRSLTLRECFLPYFIRFNTSKIRRISKIFTHLYSGWNKDMLWILIEYPFAIAHN